MNWGKRIAFLYIGFVLLIAGLIYRSSQENIDLVTADYYNQELKYQEQIDGMQATLNSGELPVIAIVEGSVVLTLPTVNAQPTGTVTFYRPNDASLDRKLELKGSSTSCALNEFESGLYQVKIAWSTDAKNYFHETSIYIP